MKKPHWLDLSEYVLLLGTGVGAAASAVTQQVFYTVAPLSLLVALGLLNRYRVRQQTFEATQSAVAVVDHYFSQKFIHIESKLDQYPTLETFDTFRESLLQKNREAFIKLTNSSDALQHQIYEQLRLLETLDISRVHQDIGQLQDQYTHLGESLTTITAHLNRLSSQPRVEGLETAITELKMEMMQVRVGTDSLSYEARSSISALQDQIDTLSRPLQSLPPSSTPTHLKQEVGELIKAVAELVPKQDFVALATALQQLQNQQQSFQGALATLERTLQGTKLELTESTGSSQSSLVTTYQATLAQLQADLATLKRQVAQQPKPAQLDYLPLPVPLDVVAIQQQVQSLAVRLERTEAVLETKQPTIPVRTVESLATEAPALPLDQLVFDFPKTESGDLSQRSRTFLQSLLQQSQSHLILIWPWSTQPDLDDDLITQFEDLLQRQVKLSLGWCHRGDRREGRFLKSIDQRWSTESSHHRQLQQVLSRLLPLKQQYPKHFQFKILGTDENFLVCDRRFALLGVQNLMTQNSVLPTLEVKLRTTDPAVIQSLVSRFERPDIDGLNPTALFNRGTTRYDLGDYTGAVADYTQVIRLNPKEAIAYNNRGLAHFDLGNVEAALADFSQGIYLDPQHFVLYCNRGWLYAEAGALPEAIADFNAAVTLNSNSPIAYFYRGTLRQKQGNWRSALADFNRAIEHSPNTPLLHCYRGALYQRLGKLQAAIADLEAATQQFTQQRDSSSARRIWRTLKQLKRQVASHQAAKPTDADPRLLSWDRSTEETISTRTDLPFVNGRGL